MSQAQNQENSKEEVNIPNPFDIWKKMYFIAEEACSSTVREAISTNVFANTIDAILNQYLVGHKLSMQTSQKLLSYYPFPSKEDVARVAELVIAMEDKIDNIESTLMIQLTRIAQALSAQPSSAVENDQKLSADTAVSNVLEQLTLRLDRMEGVIERLEKFLYHQTQNSNPPSKKHNDEQNTE
ncbi:MAG: hypothetical protein ACOX4L_06910 [Bacillota bacterium]|jgi:polyhydroxyalkanoic acid synthase PhaR subunit